MENNLKVAAKALLGKIPRQESKVCPHCKGFGHGGICPTCNGSGRIPRTDREARYREVLKKADLYFQREQASGNFMGDDEHELWCEIKTALKEEE